ncbi:MAG: aminoacetone oxidase family FAD-binding enzyme [Bacilli bacterium]|nr:aminoacetone oxidase family FAD-binding enzyme [Bacilli bacterium]
MKRIVIVGAGVSGLTAAIKVKNDNNEVMLLEKNSEVGKKILITGNGRCNFLNDKFDPTYFHSVKENNLKTIIVEENKNKVLDFITELGIEYKIKNGYYYPFTNKASTIRDTFLEEVLRRNIKIKYNYNVEKIEKNNDKFLINNEIECDILIISTGGKSYKITGSTGDGYKLLNSFNHSVTDLSPSLVQITTEGKYLKKLKGVRTDTIVSIWNDKEKIKEEYGELQLTDYGVSGICVFNLSRYVSSFDNTYIKINFLPYIETNLNDYLEKKDSSLSIYDILVRMLNDKIVNVILELTNIDKNKKYNELSIKEKELLSNYLTSFTLKVTGTKSFDEAQVTKGGIDLNEIDLSSFESKKINNLYIIGEVLDVDGDCGGYNISFAIISALIASNSIRGKK